MGEVVIGLCVDPVGNANEVTNLCRLLDKRKIRATVTAAGTVGKKPISTLSHLRPFLEGGHEIVNHTLSHPVRIGQLEMREQEKEILLQHQRLLDLGKEYGKPFPVNGFRAPFYAYDESLFHVLPRLGYSFDSSSLYSPLLGVPFKPFVRNGILEIPVFFPDDMTLLDRMLLTPEEVFQVWWRAYGETGRYFIFTIHPYGSAKDQRTLDALETFLEEIEKGGGNFLTLSEIAGNIRKELG